MDLYVVLMASYQYMASVWRKYDCIIDYSRGVATSQQGNLLYSYICFTIIINPYMVSACKHITIMRPWVSTGVCLLFILEQDNWYLQCFHGAVMWFIGVCTMVSGSYSYIH